MRFWNNIKNIIASYASDRDWWIEISTEKPRCIYYFEPFQHHQKAETMCPEYIEDLHDEGARVIKTKIKRCHPDKLTVCED